MQVRSGAQAGGVAGRLREDGRPEFVYLEITGYFLTTVAWLARCGATSRAHDALERGQRAFRWLEAATANGNVPATRIYLDEDERDWRNDAIFTFDLAIAARGVASLAAVAALARGGEVTNALAGHVESISPEAGPLRSHALRPGREASLPDRWSTRPGPHHAKAAAALLQLSDRERALTDKCEPTIDYWAEALQDGWPCRELHPLLYGLEGLLIARGALLLDVVADVFARLLDLQASDGSLPEVAGESEPRVRADVLAQALRIGNVLRANGRLTEDEWRGRLDGLAEALLRHVRSDGAVVFSRDQALPNAWCAMFAHQALVLHARQRSTGSLPPEAAELLI